MARRPCSTVARDFGAGVHHHHGAGRRRRRRRHKRKRRGRRRINQRGGFLGLFGLALRTGLRFAARAGLRAAARAGARSVARVATRRAVKSAARAVGRKALSYGKRAAIQQVRKMPQTLAKASVNYGVKKMHDRRQAIKARMAQKQQRGGFGSFRSLGLGNTDLTDLDIRPWDRQSRSRAKKRH